MNTENTLLDFFAKNKRDSLFESQFLPTLDGDPQLSFAISALDQGNTIEITFQNFDVRFEGTIEDRKAIPVRVSDIIKVNCIPDSSHKRLFNMTIGLNAHAYYGTITAIDDRLRSKLPSLEGKMIAIDHWDESDTVSQQFMIAAARQLKSLHSIRQSKGYKFGWIYYKFAEYIAESKKRGYVTTCRQDDFLRAVNRRMSWIKDD